MIFAFSSNHINKVSFSILVVLAHLLEDILKQLLVFQFSFVDSDIS